MRHAVKRCLLRMLCCAALVPALLPAQAAGWDDPSCGLVYNAPTCLGVRSATKLTAVPLPITAPAVDDWRYSFGPGGGEVLVASHPTPGNWASALVIEATESLAVSHSLQAGARSTSAATRADLRSGSLGLRFNNLASAGPPTGEFVEVGLYEVLQFEVAAGTPSFTVAVAMAVHGNVVASDFFGLPLLTAGVRLVGAGSRVGPTAGADLVVTAAGRYDTVLHFTAQVFDLGDGSRPWSAAVGLAATLKAQPFATALYDLDFINTATLSVALPAGVAMQSASGLFLTPVPEPATAWLALAGLAVLAARRAAPGNAHMRQTS